jgi:hypothetical protein
MKKICAFVLCFSLVLGMAIVSVGCRRGNDNPHENVEFSVSFTNTTPELGAIEVFAGQTRIDSGAKVSASGGGQASITIVPVLRSDCFAMAFDIEFLVRHSIGDGEDGHKLRNSVTFNIASDVNFEVHFWHVWDGGGHDVVVKQNTCEEGGSMKHVCNLCDYEVSWQTEPREHDWGDYVVLQEALMCGDEAVSRGVCRHEDCDAVDYQVDVRSCTWSRIILITQPTCAEHGLSIIACELRPFGCMEVLVGSEIVTPPLGGVCVWDDVWYLTPASCGVDAIEMRPCLNAVHNGCGVFETRTLYGTALDCQFGEWEITIPPQVGVSGEEKRVCVHGCGEYETREIAALPEVYGIYMFHESDVAEGGTTGWQWIRLFAAGQGFNDELDNYQMRLPGWNMATNEGRLEWNDDFTQVSGFTTRNAGGQLVPEYRAFIGTLADGYLTIVIHPTLTLMGEITIIYKWEMADWG